jgi:hypothetical protein
MEELIEDGELLQWGSAPRERGLGESWEAIDHAMRKNLHIPSLLPFASLQERTRERQFTEVGSSKTKQNATKRQVLRSEGQS